MTTYLSSSTFSIENSTSSIHMLPSKYKDTCNNVSSTLQIHIKVGVEMFPARISCSPNKESYQNSTRSCWSLGESKDDGSYGNMNALSGAYQHTFMTQFRRHNGICKSRHEEAFAKQIISSHYQTSLKNVHMQFPFISLMSNQLLHHTN